ncbi:GOLPH3/VPS74 family protein [Streptomyces spongiae]|uniref:GPP34 family phosphoprotein n=1 Tax=Streptomyces spongiae TaxID=565072 RepID=A0A5N8XMK9_9ACTN|nr:GPP34 family phosphoprotein [Streptomyces spongiae]MPY60607.1 GPP34 family phosphoprotein [Streptomyces spongiae]
MTTPRDLLITTMEVAPDRPVEQGDLSLALAGAELCDLLDTEGLTLEGDRIVPGLLPALDDRLLDAAASSLNREAPYESVEDWLWRRGRGLHATYLADLEAAGDLTRQHNRWLPLRTDRTALADSPARRHAAERRSSGEPVLAVLAAAVGIGPEPAEDLAELVDDEVVTVLAAVNDALMELEAVRQRRSIEQAAFDNVWRGP